MITSKRMVVLAGLSAWSCSKEATGPATYRYSLLVDGRLPTIGAEVRINGVTAGTDVSEVTVKRETWLSDPSTVVELVVPTTCGKETVKLISIHSRDKEAQERGSVAQVRWSLDLPMPTPWRTDVYFDNQFTGKPAKVRIGTLERDLPAATAVRGEVTLGTCATARRVEIDGVHAGDYDGKDDRSGAIISVASGQCYLTGTAVWSVAQIGGTEPVDMGSMADASVFRVAGRVESVPAVSYFPAKTMPETLTGGANENSLAHRMLDPIPCELASRFQAAKDRKAK